MKRVGPYQVVQELGRGGMGVVFEVLSPAGERLALKMLLEPERGNPERFRREADVLRFLGRHPGIVTFRDAGLEGEHPYVVMDFVQGRTLSDALAAGMPRDEALAVLVAVARALHFAHEAEVVHRDVKPDNVLIDAYGRAVLSDFGVAKCLQADRLTLTGEVVGTPAYMAPEQLDGHARSVDRRTDVYALGAVLYEVLSGARPFAGSKIQVAKQVMLDDPPPLSEEVPADLRALCRACMAKEQGQRPASAEEVARALEAHLGGGAPPPIAPPRRGASRGLALGLATLALALGLGVGWAARSLQPKELRPEPVVPNPTPEPSSTELAAARSPDVALQLALASGAPTGAEEAWTSGRRLRAAVRLDPAAASRRPEVAQRLVTSANLLLDVVVPAQAADARLVHEARDLLVVARLLAPTIDLGKALGRFEDLRRATDRAVRRAASPWRELWSRSGALTLPASYVEQALAMPRWTPGPGFDLAERETYPVPWGAVHYQLHVEAMWWTEFVDQRARYRVAAEFFLQRPDLSFLRFAVGEELMRLGRYAEGRFVLTSLVPEPRKELGFKTLLRVGRYLSEWLGDSSSALPYLRRAVGVRRAAAAYLAGALLDAGDPKALQEARQALEASKSLLGRTWKWLSERLRLARLEGESPPEELRRGHEQRRRSALGRGPKWEAQ